MKLYFSPAYCSQAVHIALREAGLAADLVQVDTVAGRTADGGDFRVPAAVVQLEHRHVAARVDRSVVAALLQYVADLAPAAGLIPPVGSRERFEALQWLTFTSSELHKGFSPWLFHKETADSTRKAVKDKLKLRIADVDTRLQGRDWLVGRHFTVADAYAFVILSWAPMVGMSLAAWPNVVAWMDRVRSREAVRAALRAEGLLKE